MKSDNSRSTFDPRKHFSSVRMQQGRVQIDADSNEQIDIVSHRVETEAGDVIGLCGAPFHYPAFHIVKDVADLSTEEKKRKEANQLPAGFNVAPPNFLISAGRYYVDGILCENEHITSYLNQPDLPDPKPITDPGLYVVYVDVWERLVTALDDPSIREIALGGPDTATRAKTVWQVKHWFAVDKDKDKVERGNCATTFDVFDKLIAPSDGSFSARTKPAQTSTDPCVVPPGAGYTGLENQFYRVEIHDGGEALDATTEGTAAGRVADKSDQIRVTGSWQIGQALEIFSQKTGDDPMNGTLAYITNVESEDELKTRKTLRTTGTKPKTKTIATETGGKILTLDIDVSKIPLDELFVRPAKATFKWSRDNGVVVTAIQSIDGQKITVHDLGPDDMLGFKEGQWVELSDDALELNGLPGQLAKITRIDSASNVITLSVTPSLIVKQDPKLPNRHPKLRRWDGVGPVQYDSKAPDDSFVDLENGVQVRFFEGQFRTGDYWTVPARTATADTQSGNIEWPQDASKNPLPQLPFGIKHHYCRLAMLHWDGKNFDVVEDCRNLFPPITELTSMFYVSGDGQEAMPNNPLPQPLQVGIFNGRWPVENAVVRFSVSSSAGKFGRDFQEPDPDQGQLKRIDGSSGPKPTTLPVKTGPDGIASCVWLLDPDVGKPSQQVEARLLDAGGKATPALVRFDGNLSIADQVAYEPGDCQPLRDDKTVQKALDRLSHLISLYEVSGNNQEIVPGEALQPLVVLAANRCGAVTDTDKDTDKKLQVHFKVVSGEGKVNGHDEIDVDTANGQATCVWAPGPTAPNQEVEASLMTSPSHSAAEPTRVRFTSTLSLASHVSYDPSKCPGLKGENVTNVQDAIDHLCEVHQGGCCDVTVGKGGQFERLDEAIEKLLHDKRTDICICLLPGEHRLPQGLIIADPNDKEPVINVKIAGCGLATRILVGDSHFSNESYLRIGPLASFTLRDVALSTQTNDKLIHCAGVGEVVIENCHLYAYTNLVGRPSLLTIERANFISVSGSYLSSLFEGPDPFDLPKVPRPVPFSTRPLGSLAEDIATQLARAKPEVRQEFVKPYQEFVRAGRNIHDTERATMEGAIKTILELDPRLSDGPARVDEAVRALYYGNTLVLMDANADTLVENNRFTGRIMLYGNSDWLTPDEWKIFARRIQKGSTVLTAPKASLQIRNNLLTGISIDKSVTQPPNKEKLPGLYGRCLLAENWCYYPTYHLLASHLNLSSNQFNCGSDTQSEVGIVAGRSAAIVGNSAPNPASQLFCAVAPPTVTPPISPFQLAANFLDVRLLP